MKIETEVFGIDNDQPRLGYIINVQGAGYTQKEALERAKAEIDDWLENQIKQD